VFYFGKFEITIITRTKQQKQKQQKQKQQKQVILNILSSLS